MKRVVTLLLLLLLVGCSTVPTSPLGGIAQLSLADLTAAAAIAQAGGDPAGEACWIFLNKIVTAQETQPLVGAAASIEMVRLMTQPGFQLACGPLGLAIPPVGPGAAISLPTAITASGGLVVK